MFDFSRKVSIEMGFNGTAFIRWKRRDFQETGTTTVPVLQKICKRFGFAHNGVNAWEGPSWRLAKLVGVLRENNFVPVLGPSVAYEMGRLAAQQDDPGSDARADARIDALEAASGRTFRSYQREDVRWMERTGSCINANEMRTGKTVELLAMIPPEGALIICPLNVRGTWIGHLQRWMPWAKVVTSKHHVPAMGSVVVTHYEALWDPQDYPSMRLPAGMLLVVDEGHAIKNPSTKRNQRVSWLAGKTREAGGRVIVATGTPAPNEPGDEIWPLLEVIGAGRRLFGDKRTFKAEAKIDYGPDGIAGRLAQVMTRRTLDQVVANLPPYTWDDQIIPEEDLRSHPEAAGVLAGLTALWDQVKHEENVWAAINREPRHLGEYSRLRRILAEVKYYWVEEWAREMLEAGKKGVVFSSHRAPIERLGKAGLGWGYIIGGMPEAERQRQIDAFQAGYLNGMAFTTGASSEGVDYSLADNALSVDRDYVPGRNDQAAARVISVANPRPKFGVRLMIDHPIEHRVDEILARKMLEIGGTIGYVGAAGRKDSVIQDTLKQIGNNAPPGLDLAELSDSLGDLLA